MYDIPEVMLDARFLHRMVGYADNEHDPHIVGMDPDHGISSARPDVTWPISHHWEELTSFRVDDELNNVDSEDSADTTISYLTGHLPSQSNVRQRHDALTGYEPKLG